MNLLNEARRGNIVNYKGNPYKVLGVNTTRFILKPLFPDSGCETLYVGKKHVSPIYIKISSLYDLGFKKKEGNLPVLTYYLGNASYLLFLKDTEKVYYKSGAFKKEVECFHELQNLYYCLNDQELMTVKNLLKE